MKISIIQGAFLPVPPVLGGAVEKIWYKLGQEFAALGHEVVHIGRSHPDLPNKNKSHGVTYVRITGYDTPSSIVRLKWRDLLYSVRAVKEIPEDTDIVITNTFWSPLLVSGPLRKKVCVSVERLPKGQMWLYKQAPLLRVNSGPVADAIRRELPVQQHRRMVIIPNPLPFQGLPPVHVDEKKHVLLYVGRLHPEKGLELLIKAFKTLNSGWKLRIVGPSDVSTGGGGQPYLESLKQLAGDANVEFTGPVFDMNLLNEYYAEASIFVYPSVAEKGETFGLAPLEAMAWGCVPVVSDLACFRDFIHHGANGLVFDHRSNDAVALLNKAIDGLQTDAERRHKLAEQALNVRQSHSVSYIASQFIDAFEGITGKRNVDKPIAL
ncbi:glycosyltransferase family 4 protein [Spirosoma pollinicola]|uniref:glycosyltransferase family 4 protein n=1 Tax=Spirosoma pollinicola TaxID=2057025 RepID=UPI0012FD16F8|nr:glycosyltransferase family 4 protein [Spirosoma pollinicola]